MSGEVRLVDTAGSGKTDESGVVVWLTGDDSFTPVRNRAVKMLQEHRRFVPHVLAIATGTRVDFPNLDPIFHNAFSNFDGKIFDLGLYAPETSRGVRFNRAGIVRVFCNIHSTMSAVIVVVNSNNFAVSGGDGHFTLTNVKPGHYEMHFFHERATPAVLNRLTREIVVNEGDRVLEPVAVSEAGYLPVAHKNKYGHDYPRDSEEREGYGLPVQ